MTPRQQIAVAAIAVAAVVQLWLFRYDLEPAPGPVPVAYRLDRWTGAIWFFTAGDAWEVKAKTTPAPSQ